MTSFIHFEQARKVTRSSNPETSNSDECDITDLPSVKAWSAIGFDRAHPAWLGHASRNLGLWPRQSHARQPLFWLLTCLPCRHQVDRCNHRYKTLRRSGTRQGRHFVFHVCSWSTDPLQSPHQAPRPRGAKFKEATYNLAGAGSTNQGQSTPESKRLAHSLLSLPRDPIDVTRLKALNQSQRSK
jgi:hypothetical protein